MRRLILTMALIVGLVSGACSSDDPSGTTTGASSDGMGGSMGDQAGADDTSAFGMPGNEVDVDRTIEVAQFDSYRFEPASISVTEGETVMFKVSNQGSSVHEFVIGDDSFQDQHEEEMADMGGMAMADEPNAVTLDPGESKALIWTFSRSGSFLYGCHVSGHYAQGMMGTIEVVQ